MKKYVRNIFIILAAIVAGNALASFSSIRVIKEYIVEYFELVSTPTSPKANRFRTYFKDDGYLYKLNSAGEEKKIGGTGTSPNNFILNPSLEDDLVGWVDSGTTLVVNTFTDFIEGNEKYLTFTPSGVGDFVETILLDKPDSSSTRGMATIRWRSADIDEYNFQVCDATVCTLITPVILGDTGGTEWQTAVFSFFDFPAQYKIRIEALGTTSSIDLDQAFLGREVLPKELVVAHEALFVDVSIFGANPALGAGEVSISNAALQMELHSGTAEIPCVANPSTGLTCAVGNEIVGISFEAPRSGKYKICAGYTFNAGTNLKTYTRLVHTENDSDIVLSTGSQHQGHYQNAGSSEAPVRQCNAFDVSAGTNTFKVFSDSTGGILLGDRVANSYDRDINITVEEIPTKQIATIVRTKSDLIGEIISSASPTPPVGFMLADGSAISRTDFKDLFDKIGIAYGEGDATTTFNIPDLRGKFIRGADDGVGNDPDAATRVACATGGATGDNLGSCQDDAFQGHWHTVLTGTGGANNTAYGFSTSSRDSTTVADPRNANVQAPVIGTNGTPRTSNESRPMNVYVKYYIRYDNSGLELLTPLIEGSETITSSHTVTGITGTGSGATRIRTFGDPAFENDQFRYVPDNVNGDSFEIKQAGTYNFDYQDTRVGAAGAFGVSKNATLLSTDYLNLPIEQQMTMQVGEAIAFNDFATASGTAILEVGDILRPHLHIANTNPSTPVFFRLTATIHGTPGVITSDAVVTSSAGTTAKKLRVETCSYNFTPTTLTNDCNGWIDNIARTDDAWVTLNFIAGTFSVQPVCTYTSSNQTCNHATITGGSSNAAIEMQASNPHLHSTSGAPAGRTGCNPVIMYVQCIGRE